MSTMKDGEFCDSSVDASTKVLEGLHTFLEDVKNERLSIAGEETLNDVILSKKSSEIPASVESVEDVNPITTDSDDEYVPVPDRKPSLSWTFVLSGFVLLVSILLSIGFSGFHEVEGDEYSGMMHQFVEYVRDEFCTHGEIWCQVSIEAEDGNFTTIESGKMSQNETLLHLQKTARERTSDIQAHNLATIYASLIPTDLEEKQKKLASAEKGENILQNFKPECYNEIQDAGFAKHSFVDKVREDNKDEYILLLLDSLGVTDETTRKSYEAAIKRIFITSSSGDERTYWGIRNKNTFQRYGYRFAIEYLPEDKHYYVAGVQFSEHETFSHKCRFVEENIQAYKQEIEDYIDVKIAKILHQKYVGLMQAQDESFHKFMVLPI